MEAKLYYPEYKNIFSNNPLSSLIRNYNIMFALLKPALGLDQNDEIEKIERCLYTTDDFAIFWNYLEATHSKMKEIKGIKDGLRCYKFTLKTGKTITFSTDNKRNCKLHPGEVIFLDDIYKMLTPEGQNKFNQLHIKNCILESNYFKSPEYTSKVTEINNICKGEISDILANK